MKETLHTKIPLWLVISTAAVVEIFLLMAMLDMHPPRIAQYIPERAQQQYQPQSQPPSDSVDAITNDLEDFDTEELDQDLEGLEDEVNQ